MKPLIKWPGGKSREINKFVDLIPQTIERYIEPFFGGGAVYFHIKAKQSLVNDIDSNLINFYQRVKEQDQAFFVDVNHIAEDWETLVEISEILMTEFEKLTKTYRKNGMSKEDLKFNVSSKISSNLGSRLLIGENAEFQEYLIASVFSKIHRIVKLERKHDIEFDQTKILDHLETAVRSAYYTLLRDSDLNKTDKYAKFYFIREFCYGSMFRYNKSGKFNIPYGGINYNSKSFSNKISHLRTPQVQNLLKNTEFHNIDFQDFLSKVKPKSNDFVFFDPPYDTDFKDYGNSPFTFDDHERLAQVFGSLPSKNVMIINSNQKIMQLYRKQQDLNSNIKIIDYEKTYTYNVRGRNTRETRHLLITNF